MTSAPAALIAIAALFAFTYPLGVAARRALFPSLGAMLDPVRRALVTAALGNAALSIAVGAAWLAGNRLSRALPIAAALLALLAIVAAVRARRAGIGTLAGPRETHRAVRVFLLALVPVIPLLWYHDPLTPIDDSLDHVASLARRVEVNAVFPKSDLYAASRETGPDLRKGLLHAQVALIAQTTRIPVLTLWNALPFFFAYWALLAVWAAARTLCTSRAAPWIAVVIFALTYDGGVGGAWLSRMGHPGRAIHGPFWAAWALALDPSLRLAWTLWPILGFGMAAIHSYSAIQIAVSAAFLAAFALLFGRSELRAAVARPLRSAGLLVLGAAPYLAYRMLTSGPAVDTIHTERQGLLLVTDALFTLSPHWILWGWGTAGLLAIPATLLLLRRARRETAAAFNASGVLGPLFVIANPLAMPIAYRVIGYLAARLTWFTPHVFVLADLIAAAGDRLRARVRREEPAARALAAPALALLVAIVIGASVAASASTFVRLHLLGAPGSGGFRRHAAEFRALDEAIPRPSVIVSDPATGYAIPALTRHRPISASPQHTSPNDPDARDRLRDTRHILSPYVAPRETIALLREYGAEYVLLNDSPEPAQLRYLWHADSRTFEAMREKFDASPELFEPIMRSGGLHLYRVTDAARSGPLPDASPPARAVPLCDACPEGSPAGLAGFRFLGGEVGTSRTSPGGALLVRTRWLKTEETDEGNRHLTLRVERLEPRDESLLLNTSPFAKLLRIVRDARSGTRTRARIDFAPGGGFLPPNDWPVGRAIEDESEVRLPRNLAPGRYSARVKLAETPFYANVRLADLVAPSGERDGELIGQIEIAERPPAPL